MTLHRRRRGLAVPEWFCILGFIAIGLIWFVGKLGVATEDKLNTTASDLINPQSLAGRFSGNEDGGSESGSESSNSGNSGGSQSKGNNGVGNGIDGAPPGNPPENDGEGTGPGNPGNKGGAKK